MADFNERYVVGNLASKHKASAYNHGHVEGLFEGAEIRQHKDGSHSVRIRVSAPNSFAGSRGVVGRQHMVLSAFVPRDRADLIEAIGSLRGGDLIAADYTCQIRAFTCSAGAEGKEYRLEATSLGVVRRGVADEELDSLPAVRAAQLSTALPDPDNSESPEDWCAVPLQRRDTPNRFPSEEGMCHYNACNYGFVQGAVQGVWIGEKGGGYRSFSVRIGIPGARRSPYGDWDAGSILLTARAREDDERGVAFFEGLSVGEEIQVCYQIRATTSVKQSGSGFTCTHKFTLISAKRCCRAV